MKLRFRKLYKESGLTKLGCFSELGSKISLGIENISIKNMSIRISKRILKF